MFGEKTGQVLTLMVAVIKLTFYAVCFTLSQKYGIILVEKKVAENYS